MKTITLRCSYYKGSKKLKAASSRKGRCKKWSKVNPKTHHRRCLKRSAR